MLRTTLRSARVLGGQPVAAVASRQLSLGRVNVLQRRYLADRKPPSSQPPVIPPSETSSSERAPPATIDDVGETKAATSAGGIPRTPPSPPSGASTSADAAAHATEDDVGQSSIHGSKIHPLAGGKPKPPATEDDVGESRVNASKIDPLAGGKPTPPSTIDDVGESSVVQGDVATPPPPSPPPSTPSPPVKPRKSLLRRLRNLILTLFILGVAGFGGGVMYSRINDNFHDFFTEYIPFGERAVLYLEEQEFRKRYKQPAVTERRPRETGDAVRIPAQSGASWRVADTAEAGKRQSSASKSQKAAGASTSTQAPKSSKPEAEKANPAEGNGSAPKPAENKAAVAAPSDPPAGRKPVQASATEFKAPEVNEPSRFPPLQRIDPIKLDGAKEPIVQDLVHMLNDLILVINADGAHGKYATTIDKAKADAGKIGKKLQEMKDAVEKKAAGEVRTKVGEFDEAATALIDRVEKAMANQEVQWRQEFETEMKSVRENYDERVKLLLDRESQLNGEKLKNKLAQQAIALQKEFIGELKSKVEAERDGRLGRLEELSSAVKDLQNLTTSWNDVVDSNLKTQQLHVAVEAVRNSLESATHPRPFLRELVALKEIASDNPAVSAAIGSVNPVAYQKSLPTSSQLADRFRRVAEEVRKASLLPDEAGVASHASSWMLSHMLFRKKGLAEGSDVESVLTRTQTFLEEGDLDGAAREMNELQGWAKTLSKDWLGEVRKVLEVQQALDVIATEARLQSLRVD